MHSSNTFASKLCIAKVTAAPAETVSDLYMHAELQHKPDILVYTRTFERTCPSLPEQPRTQLHLQKPLISKDMKSRTSRHHTELYRTLMHDRMRLALLRGGPEPKNSPQRQGKDIFGDPFDCASHGSTLLTCIRKT
ncbi:hypothetical protein ABBQ32_013198 [Trebouxia sp. C0010 RCD-2024]